MNKKQKKPLGLFGAWADGESAGEIIDSIS
jgi:hypothetical protein